MEIVILILGGLAVFAAVAIGYFKYSERRAKHQH